MKADPAPGTRVRFGKFEADVRSGELRRDGFKVKIQELPFQVLVLLLERPGEVVTREDLRGRVWPADTFVDFEQGLNKAINKLRESLGDDATNPRFVETLPRRGYRFIAPVDRIEPGAARAGNDEPAEQSTGAALPGRRMIIAIAGALLVIAIVALAGWWRAAKNLSSVPSWTGELLPGPTSAFWPRVSPDGHLIAFLAMINNLTQVAVVDPETGNWTVLTHNRGNGSINSLCWSPDGSRIYFDRFVSIPRGIYSVPSLGGEERLVLADAANPVTLSDGTMLVLRVDSDRKNQIYHFWPDTGRLQALGAWVKITWSVPIRAFPEGKEAVFFGTVKDKAETAAHLYLLDVATGVSRRLAPELAIANPGLLFPLAVTPDGGSVLIDLPSGNLHRIVAIQRSGTGRVRTLMTRTSETWSLDAAPDGSLYVDQVDRPLEILSLSQSGGTPEVLASSESFADYSFAEPVRFSDGRLILPTRISGRPRLLLGKPGGSFVSLLQANEETAPPFAAVGDDRVAFMAGSHPAQTLALASVKEGRILKRFESTRKKVVGAVVASPDGKTLYYAASRKIWSIATQGGSPREICSGDSVTVGPGGQDLIVELIAKEGVRLERVPLSGGTPRPIRVKGEPLICFVPLGPNAVNNNARLLVPIIRKDTYFSVLGVLDLTTGELTQIPVNYAGDISIPGWTSDGRILTTAFPLRSHIWRFRPTLDEAE